MVQEKSNKLILKQISDVEDMLSAEIDAEVNTLTNRVSTIDPMQAGRDPWPSTSAGRPTPPPGVGPTDQQSDEQPIIIGPVGNVLNNPRLFDDKLALDSKYQFSGAKEQGARLHDNA